MKRFFSKTIAIAGSVTIAISANAQITLTKNLPPVGAKWDDYGKVALNATSMPTPPSPSFGFNQMWDYDSVYAHSAMGAQNYGGQYEVIALNTIAQEDLDSAATASYAVKFTSASTMIPDFISFYEDIGDSLYQIANKNGTNPTQPTSYISNPDLNRLFVFNTPYNSIMVKQDTDCKYVGDGTLKIGGYTINNLALFESVNLSVSNTRQFIFYQITPYFQQIASFTFNDSTKNYIMSLWIDGDIPASPTNLTATPVNSIELNWQDNADNEDGFYIESTQDTVIGNWTPIATVGTDVTTYLHTGLTNGITYYYRVSAYNASGNSSWSNIAAATEGTSINNDADNVLLPFVIYPNPAKETVTIGNVPIGSTVNITDITGKTVFNSIVNNEKKTISATEFANGIYNIRVENKGTTANRQLVINK